MNRCDNCKITLAGNYRRCPLCKGKLTVVPGKSDNAFPIIRKDKSGSRLMSFLAFCSVAVVVVCVAVNLILPSRGWWMWFVLGGISSFWVSFPLIMKKRRNLPKTLLWQVGIITLLAYVWDRFTGHRGWSLDYVFPILCTGAMVAMFVIAKARRLNIQDYIIYLIIDCIFGILPLIFLATGKLHVVIPSVVCFASAIIFLAELLLFEGRAFFAEIQRRLHM